MFGVNPVSLFRLEKLEALGDAALVRIAAKAELDAINFYLQIAGHANDECVRKLLEDIVGEEMEHLGELLELLRRLDPLMVEMVERGVKEARRILG